MTWVARYKYTNEEQNNHYLQTLKKSNLWDVYCGVNTYDKILDYTGFDLGKWMNNYIAWEEDFDKQMFAHLKNNGLTQYLEW